MAPYYLMRYEDVPAEIAEDDERTARLIAKCLDFRLRLAEETLGQGDAVLFEQLVALMIEVSDHLTRSHESLQRKVRAVMGGVGLELWAGRLEREAREARERGLEQGLERGVDGLSRKLLELGVDESLIAQAVEALRAEGATAQGDTAI